MADIFHTFFGISGLSLLGYFSDAGPSELAYTRCKPINPTYALPEALVTQYDLEHHTRAKLV